LESFARLIRFDLPGTGMSDPVALDELPTMEEWRDCVRVVMDAAGSRRAVLLASDAAGAVAIPFAATYPDRAAELVLIDTWARLYRDEDYSFGLPERTRESGLAWWTEGWGTGRQLELTAPAIADDPHELEAVGRLERFSTSPGVARAFFRMVAELDVREILPAVRVPTLVVHRAGDRYIRVEHGRYLAERIPEARWIELPGEDHFPFYGDTEAVVSEVRSFLATLPEPGEIDRMLATLLVTDIVGSTRLASELGDKRWRELLDRHDELVRAELARYRGQVIRSTGDGVLAMFRRRRPCRSLCAAIRAAMLPFRPPHPGRSSHRRGRAAGRRPGRDRRPYRGARRRAGRERRGARLTDRQGPDGRRRPHVRAPRLTPTERRARRLADLRCRQLLR
jgi:pimeloyl-ACP methyl ester carboxylesterase